MPYCRECGQMEVSLSRRDHTPSYRDSTPVPNPIRTTKRKLSAWNKFVKVNSKKPRFRYKSGAKRGKVNLKALGIAYRKKKR